MPSGPTATRSARSRLCVQDRRLRRGDLGSSVIGPDMFPFAGEHQPALLPAVEALLDAVGLTELAEVLDGHPELLDPGADLVITQFMAGAVMQDDDALTEAFGRRLRLVRLARKDGAEAALADL